MPELRPITQKEAFAFIRDHHRHHNVPVGALWHHACHDEDGRLCGVAIVGRPFARKLDDGLSCEVTRLCTDGTFNACSILYAAARRVALDQLFVARPLLGSADYTTPIENLFLCGSGTHPGTGLNGRSGALAAKAILKAIRT